MKKNELKKGLQTTGTSATQAKSANRKSAKSATTAVDFSAVQTIYLRHKHSWHTKTKKEITSLDGYVVESYIPQAAIVYISK